MTSQSVAVGELPRASAKEFQEVAAATQRYFDVLYSANLDLFDRVFHKQAWLFTLQEGQVKPLAVGDYRALVASRQSPESLGAPREDQMISIDFSSPTHALVKVKARINQLLFIDHLSMLRGEQGWQIVSKTYYRVPTP